MPGLIDRTVANLREVRPNFYFNVPRGFDMLLPFLERDADFAAAFFDRLEGIFYAGAALPQSLWERIVAVAARVRDRPLWFTSAWGSTETSPAVTSVSWAIDRAGCIGAPLPGVALKLVLNGDVRDFLTNYAKAGGPHHNAVCFGDARPRIKALAEGSWCYYFQKADLARQFGEWEYVAEMADQALKLKLLLYPINAPELVTYIEGYAYTDQWEKAEQLTQTAIRLSDDINPMLCDAWLRIETGTPVTSSQQQVISEVFNQLNCPQP